MVDVLGPVRVSRDGTDVDLGRAGQRALLGLLALAGGQPLSRAELVDALWGDTPPPSAVNVLQTAVKHLRRQLEPERRPRTPSHLLPSVGSGYALRVSAEQIDLMRFRALVAKSAELQRAGDRRRAATLLGEALGLWRGVPLADITTLARHPKIVALVEERHAALASYGEALIATGAAVEALPALEAAVAEQPLDEAAHARLILAYRIAGRRAQAFAAYRTIRRRLADELGVDPGPELAAAHAALLGCDAGVGDAAPAGTGHTTGPAAPGPGLHPVPAQLPGYRTTFTGRTEQLQRLTDLLTDTQPPGMLLATVTGTAGVGKTALAVHFAHRIRHRFPDGQLYVNLHGHDPHGNVLEPAEVIAGFLSAFGVPADQVPASLDARAALLRSVLADRRVLVVLDDARDADQVRPLLPGSAGSLVLVTSRNQLTGLVAADGAHPVTLDLPSWSEARAILVQRLGTARTDAAAEAVDELVGRCARLPLALAVVAARAATHPDFPLSALAAQLRESEGGLDGLCSGDPASDLRLLFSGSYRLLSPAAKHLFRLLSLHPGPEVTPGSAASLVGVPVAGIRAPLGELTRAHLVIEHRPGRFGSHGLLRTYAAELSQVTDAEGERQEALGRVLEHWARGAQLADSLLDPRRNRVPLPAPDAAVTVTDLADRRRALAWLGEERPVLLAAVEASVTSGADRYTWPLVDALATFLRRQGYLRELTLIQRTALRWAQRDGDPRARADAHRGLGRAYIQDGRLCALTHLRQALDLYRDLADLSGQARTHLDLAALCERQEQIHACLDHAAHAAGLFRVTGDRSGSADAAVLVGRSHATLGQTDLGLRHCRDALRRYQEFGDCAGEADAWDSLGRVYDLAGDHQQAIRCHQRAIRLWRDLGDRCREAEALHRTGDLHQLLGEAGPARATWREALDLLEACGHPDTGAVRIKLGTGGQPVHAGRPMVDDAAGTGFG